MTAEQEPLDKKPRLENYDLEMENGILNLVVSLCKQKEARGLDSRAAKLETAEYLEKISSGLKALE